MDLFAALVIGAVGIDALRHVSHRRQLALAVIPITLAAHQLIEVGVWWSLEGRIPEPAGSASTVGYLIIALIVVPILLPFAVRRVEPNPNRRRWMLPFVALGVFSGVVFGLAMMVGPVHSSIGGHYIDYRVGSLFLEPFGVVYVAAVAVPLLMSSHRLFVWLGVVNVVLVAGLAVLQANGVVSLWCAAAAIQSVVIAHYLRAESGDPWKLPQRLRSPLEAR